MSIRCAILPMLLIFLLTSGLTLGQSVENNTISDNSTNSTSSAESVAMPEAPTENASTNSSAAPLKYVWAINGIENDQIIAALDQDGSDVYGQAKYEPEGGEAWNGIVDGSIDGDKVKLTITAQKGKTLESIKLNGVLADDALSGKFTKINEGKIAGRGDFNAVWISPDISSYTPAKVAEADASQTQAVAAAAPTQISNTTSTAETAQTAATTVQPPVKLGGKTKYVDVHEYAEKIGPGGDLSGVPPGMGGSGL